MSDVGQELVVERACGFCNRLECTEYKSTTCIEYAAEYWHNQWLLRSAELLSSREAFDKLIKEDGALRQFQRAVLLLAQTADASTAKNSVSIAFSWDGILPNLPFCDVEVFMYRPGGLKAQAQLAAFKERIERAEAAYSSLDVHWNNMLVERTTLLTQQAELQTKIADLEQRLEKYEPKQPTITDSWLKENVDG